MEKTQSLLILKGGIISWFPRQKGQSLSFLACIEVVVEKINSKLVFTNLEFFNLRL